MQTIWGETKQKNNKICHLKNISVLSNLIVRTFRQISFK